MDGIVIITDVGMYHPRGRAEKLLLAAPKCKSGYFDRRFKVSRLAIRYERKVLVHVLARWAAGDDGPYSSANRNIVAARQWWKLAKSKGFDKTLGSVNILGRLENNQDDSR